MKQLVNATGKSIGFLIFIWFAIAGAVATASAAQQVHLLGFVENLCPDEPHCFEFRVEPPFIIETGERIIVRFDQSTQIFDPENYELSLAQQNIVKGSHLRLLLSLESESGGNQYRAAFIWVGD